MKLRPAVVIDLEPYRSADVTPLVVRFRQERGHVLVLLRGDLDLGTCPVLHEMIGRILVSSRGSVVLDLSQLDFIDATGVGALVRARSGLEADGRVLTIRGLRPFARRVFALTGFVSQVPVGS